VQVSVNRSFSLKKPAKKNLARSLWLRLPISNITPMKIAVCVKQVPDSWAEKKMVNGRLDRESVDAVLNDLDEYAVEEALKIAEAHGGNEGDDAAHSITVISMGPDRATDAVRKALSMGANDALLITDPALAGSDALMTSKVLAAAIAAGGYDLVICGTESTDARMSVVPAMISARLGWGQLTFASRVEVDPGASKVSITRTTEAGVDEISASFPAVISVVEKINEPRYPSFKGIMAAKKKTIETKDLSAIGVAAESGWSEVKDATPRPPRAAGLKVTDENGSGAEALVNFLAEKKLI
jgi:electron transfer flavoprotein beta subunit